MQNLILIFATIFSLVHAGINPFSGLRMGANQLFEGVGVIYKVGEAPANIEPESFLSYEVLFTKVNRGQDHVEGIVFTSDALPFIGVDVGGSKSFCCSDTLFSKGLCFNRSPGQFLFNPDVLNTDSFFIDFLDLSNKTSGKLARKVVAQKTSTYRLWLVTCDRNENNIDDVNTLNMDGVLIIRNPYGFLDGEDWPFIPFFFVMVILFFFLALWWSFFMIWYRATIKYLQYWMTFVIFISWLFVIIYAADYTVYNRTGVVSLAFSLVEVFVDVAKKTSIWVLLVVLASGSTIIRPAMEKRQKIVLGIAAALYAVALAIYDFLNAVKYGNATEDTTIPTTAVLLFLIIVLIFDFSFVCWIFYSLIQSLAFLKIKQQSEKMRMFKILLVVLAVAYLVSFIFFIFQLVSVYGNYFDAWWGGIWFLDTGYWVLGEWIVMVIVAWIWRPSVNNSRYAYAEQLNDETNPNATEMNHPAAPKHVEDAHPDPSAEHPAENIDAEPK